MSPLWAALGGMGASVLTESFLMPLGRNTSYVSDTLFALRGIAGLLTALIYGF